MAIKKITLLSLIFVALATFAQGKDWAQFGRYESQNEALKTRPTVVFMGNSITDSWVDSVPSFFLDNNFVGRGISGQVSSQMLVRFQADVIDLKPKVVVILCGTNDIALNNGYISHEHIIQNIKSMCQLARANKIKPVVCSVLPATSFRWRPALTPANDIRLLNEMIKAFAKENKIPYVDYYSALADEEGGLPLKYSKDGVHPNINGYAVMQSVVLPTLKKIL
jgi:lysophospholipase L1-like esterase